MELFELILILLACVMASAILDQVISKVSLPLLQIAVGLAIALVIPALSKTEVESELFLVLFITPLLFREAKETDRRQLWDNKLSVLSMAIALVIVTVLVAGFALHWIIPSIPLAAAFACAGALGPTDAAAVQALGATITLTKRQATLLSGESLINDASGVVSFQFAIAAAVTGAFSIADAGKSFAVLFLGGIALGIVLGYAGRTFMGWLRRKGYVSITTHVIYEVMSPFLIFLFAEELGVSGILAVVAAGLVMQEHNGNIIPPEQARQQMVSNSFWEVILFVINGVIFVMLGMQLPKVLQVDAMGGIPAGKVIAAMLLVTCMIIGIRWIWLIVMGMIRIDEDSGERGTKHMGKTIRQALVTTIAGPKGAVTLSIILTIPLTLSDGTPFPQRNLIIFLTSGVILCTLLLADFALPRLAPKAEDDSKKQDLAMAKVRVLENVIQEVRQVLDEHAEAEYAPALRLALMRYRVRLMRLRFETKCAGGVLEELVRKVLDVQQEKADELQAEIYHLPVAERLPYYALLPAIRSSIGYFQGAENVGSRFEHRKGRLAMFLTKLHLVKLEDDSPEAAQIYYKTCAFAIDLEYAAIDYLKTVRDNPAQTELRKEAAEILIEEHEAALQSLWGRISYGQNIQIGDACDLSAGPSVTQLPAGLEARTAEQFRNARHHSDEADAYMMNMELDQIQKLRISGEITREQARALREEVYLMQTALLE